MTMGDAGVPTEVLPPKIQYQERLASAAKDLKKVDAPKLADTKIKLASKLHEDWRQGFKNEEGTGFVDRWRPAKADAAWLEQAQQNEKLQSYLRVNPESGATEINLTQLSYDQLPEKWQAENRDAAATALDIIDAALSEGKKLDSVFLEEASSTIHDAWRERNSYVKDDPTNVQRLDYSDPQFPESERDKDRQHVVLAAEFYAKAA
jgi:hypothetical protein